MSKFILIDGVGEVAVKKAKNAKRIILRIDASGKPVVTIPHNVPYIMAKRFANSHSDWLKKNLLPQADTLLANGKKVGRTHTLIFKVTDKPKPYSRVNNVEVTVYVPDHLDSTNSLVQAEATKACIRALRRQAEAELPKRVHALASQYGYIYNQVRIKAVKTRWGSCSSGRIINLSVWLMQLPDDLIRYVICHELTHLNHMHHKHSFWQELEGMVPDYAVSKRRLKQFRPSLM